MDSLVYLDPTTENPTVESRTADLPAHPRPGTEPEAPESGPPADQGTEEPAGETQGAPPINVADVLGPGGPVGEPPGPSLLESVRHCACRGRGTAPAAGRRRPRVRAGRAHHPPARLCLRVHAGERTAIAAHAVPGDHGESGQDLRPGRGEDPSGRKPRRRPRDTLAAPGPGRGRGYERPGPAQRTRSPTLDGPAGAGGQRGHFGAAGHLRRSLRCDRHPAQGSGHHRRRRLRHISLPGVRRHVRNGRQARRRHAHRFEPAHPGNGIVGVFPPGASGRDRQDGRQALRRHSRTTLPRPGIRARPLGRSRLGHPLRPVEHPVLRAFERGGLAVAQLDQPIVVYLLALPVLLVVALFACESFIGFLPSTV